MTSTPRFASLLALRIGVGEEGGVVLAVAVLAVVALAVVSLLAVSRSRQLLREGPLRPPIDGALVALGTLAVVDNLVFHWLLGFHRFKEGWAGSIYVEVGVVVVGAASVVVGARGIRRQLQHPDTERD